MAEKFLASLPKVSITDLPEDSKTCIICSDEYETARPPEKPAESPVKLPCSHIVGADCIAKWLTENSNSCPYCRREFFPLVIEEEEDEHWVRRWNEPGRWTEPIPREFDELPDGGSEPEEVEPGFGDEDHEPNRHVGLVAVSVEHLWEIESGPEDFEPVSGDEEDRPV